MSTYHTSRIKLNNITSGMLKTTSDSNPEYYLRPMIGNIGIFDIMNGDSVVLYGFAKIHYYPDENVCEIQYVEDETYHPKVIYYSSLGQYTNLTSLLVSYLSFLSASLKVLTGNSSDSTQCLTKSSITSSNSLEFKDSGYVFGEDYYDNNQVVALDDILQKYSSPKQVTVSVYFNAPAITTNEGFILSVGSGEQATDLYNLTSCEGSHTYSGTATIGQDVSMTFITPFLNGNIRYNYVGYDVSGKYDTAEIDDISSAEHILWVDNILSDIFITVYFWENQDEYVPCNNNYMYRKWNDIILIDNSSGQFTNYLWYQNSSAISGETGQVYYSGDTDLTQSLSMYWCRCYKSDGAYIDTCPRLFTEIPRSVDHQQSLN